jgi:hypothetical protein
MRQEGRDEMVCFRNELWCPLYPLGIPKTYIIKWRLHPVGIVRRKRGTPGPLHVVASHYFVNLENVDRIIRFINNPKFQIDCIQINICMAGSHGCQLMLSGQTIRELFFFLFWFPDWLASNDEFIMFVSCGVLALSLFSSFVLSTQIPYGDYILAPASRLLRAREI